MRFEESGLVPPAEILLATNQLLEGERVLPLSRHVVVAVAVVVVWAAGWMT